MDPARESSRRVDAAVGLSVETGLLLKRLTRAWNADDVDDICGCFTSDCVYENVPLGVTLRGHVGVATLYQETRRAFNDLHLEIAWAVATGNQFAYEWRLTGTHSGATVGVEATGVKAEMQGASVGDLHEGLIHRKAYYWDPLSLRRRLERAARAKHPTS